MPRGNYISRKTKYRKNHQTGRLQTDYLLSCQVVYLCRQPLDAGRRFSYGVSIIPDDYDPIAYVVSKSMEPKIRNSDYLFIKNTPQIDYNTIGIFQVDGTNYVKKLRQGCLKKTQSRIPRHPPRRKQPYSYHREGYQAIQGELKKGENGDIKQTDFKRFEKL